jgi:hypothetical protein
MSFVTIGSRLVAGVGGQNPFTVDAEGRVWEELTEDTCRISFFN